MKNYRSDLPPIPPRMRRLPERRGYPVPWFVAQVPETGDYDFRVSSIHKRWCALRENRCWICGDFLGRWLAFTIGPMCAVNRISAEPPAHRECAEFAVKACPFLNLKEKERRDSQLPEHEPAPGVMIMRNPEVTLIWITKTFKAISVERGRDYLVQVGDPVTVEFWREGRAATRAEILHSIETGFPLLLNAAQQQGPAAVTQLEQQRDRALQLLPAA